MWSGGSGGSAGCARLEDGTVQFELIFDRITALRALGETQGAESKLEQYLGRLAEDEIFDGM